MNSMEDHANLQLVAPILDEAIDQLGNEDRQAILLRYFEEHDFRSVGERIGSSEEAARKRVNRALEKLQRFLKRRGVTLSVTALGLTLGSGVVTAAPAGMTMAISATAVAAAATAGTTTTLTFLQFMGTKLKAGLIGIIVLGIGIPLALQHRSQTQLRDENEALRRQVREMQGLAAENTRLSNQIAMAKRSTPAGTNEQFKELMKLRGEVGVLRQEKASPASKPNGPSVLSGLTSASPEALSVIRGQQKMGMKMIYGDLAKRAKLSDEKSEKLADLLADNVMENINQITEVLREGKTPEERNRAFSEQDAALEQKVKELLGPEAFAQYQDYTHNLASYLTAEQFKGLLTGEKETKESQTKELYALMQEETKTALANAGLDENYQVVPILNFRNIASEEEGEYSLKLLEGIYDRVAGRAGTFLTPKELEKFNGFRNTAITNNRVALMMNRKMMAPAH